MRTPSVPALCLMLAVVVPAAAIPAQPGTKEPICSGDWGPGPEGTSLHERAKKVFHDLIVIAHTGVTVADKTIPYANEPVLEIDLNNVVIGGSPAAAFSAGVGMNAAGRTIGGKNHSGHDLVYTTSALYTMCDRPEAGVFLAHEIGHLAYGHAKKLEEKKTALVERLFGEWETSHSVPDGEPTSVTVSRFMKDSSGRIEKELLPIQAPLEKEADDYGRELAAKAGIPPETAEKAFLRAQDWLWAMRLEMSDAGHGGTVADRAVESAKWAADRRKDQKNAETATRRAVCAAQATSCQ